MRKLFLISIFLIANMMLFVPVISAQTISDGCTANASASGVVPASITADFAAGETIAVSVTSGDGGLFDVRIGGNLLLDDATTGSSTSYNVSADGTVTISISVTGGTGTYAISCTASGDDSDGFNGTLCHYPPGNPDAAHTITVGSENAVQTHISKHGDTLGACPEGVQTRVDMPDINITIFVIFATDSIQVFGECTDVCEEVMSTPIILIIDLDLVIINIGGGDSDNDIDDGDSDDGDVFMDVEDPEDFGFILDEVSTDGTFIIIYFLHPHPDDASIGVFQINVMDSETLLDDSILLFINTDGEIVRWTDHSVWDED